MKTSDAGKIFIKSFEQFRSKAYSDQAGYPTIGYGHLIDPTDEVDRKLLTATLTLEQAEALFETDLFTKSESFINQYVKVPLNQFEYDALASFVFNIGGPNFVNSTLLKKLYNPAYTTRDIADEMLRWNKVRINGKLVESAGLTRRRKKERDMFLGLAVGIV